MTSKFTHRELAALGIVLGGTLAAIGGVAVVDSQVKPVISQVHATDFTDVGDEAALRAAIEAGQNVKLTADIAIASRLDITEGKNIIKVIAVPNKLVNIVVK